MAVSLPIGGLGAGVTGLPIEGGVHIHTASNEEAVHPGQPLSWGQAHRFAAGLGYALLIVAEPLPRRRSPQGDAYAGL